MGVYYGWMITAIAAVHGVFSAPGQTYFLSSFVDHYIEDFHLSRSGLSLLFAISNSAAGKISC